MQASSLSMALAAQLLHSWGLQGYKAHCHTVRDFYRGRREARAALPCALRRNPAAAPPTSALARLSSWAKGDMLP